MQILEVVPTDYTPLTSALSAGITPAMVLAIIASVIGVAIVFVLMWFGVRKIVKGFMSAVTKGKLKI